MSFLIHTPEFLQFIIHNAAPNRCPSGAPYPSSPTLHRCRRYGRDIPVMSQLQHLARRSEFTVDLILSGMPTLTVYGFHVYKYTSDTVNVSKST